MKRWALVLAMLAGPVAAHPGAHVHPHDGASWLAVLGALSVVALAGGVAAVGLRRKR
ncbi:LPXTG cell wall anchor domain-containing protein [Thalassococcus sp. CAU 1522]|uniref:LPXTG cell wall anchor domain-containing protein n=1 Tax=Thalassococcus arenae TaxID=2851652 RepID=A0ABS6NCE8_9RHOB|nr:LPXTG cell wall anchor domain-containing protein [Thalassococcus arenae]MBV2361702.1 LPXTG cell wall anchor domain-containing protein [Thalassococcus arenae]